MRARADADACARALPAALVLALLAGCAGTPSAPHRTITPMPAPGSTAVHPRIVGEAPAMPAAGSGRGGYYQDDGPGENPPAGLLDVPDAVVRNEAYAKYANRPYVVFGQTYTPLINQEPFTQRGVASWYGKKFHGQKTSSGELYDMYKMTAAHPTLPIPSYARITSLESGQSVVVRINDRGPFHSSRVVDVSYTAALKLGLLGKGSHQVEIERVLPGDETMIATTRRNAPAPERPAASPAIVALMLEDRAPADAANPMAVVTVTGALAAAPTPALTADTTPLAGGYYLQLGAFSRADKADEVRAQLAQSGATLGTLDVVVAGPVYRVMGGPFATRADASMAAQTLPASMKLKPLVVRR
jgi:rare lipoprotein A